MGCWPGVVRDCDGRRTEPSKGGMIVRKRAVLVAELIPQRDGGLDDPGLGGSALPFLAEVFCEQRFDNTRQVLRDLADVGEEILIERQIDGALAGIDVVAKLHVHSSTC